MDIAFCSMLLPEEKNLAARAKKRLPGISVHKVARALINGLDANLDQPVRIFNIINTLNYPNFPDLIFHTEKWQHVPDAEDLHIGYVNLIGIKYITQAWGLFRKLDHWRKNSQDDNCVVCVHHIYFPMMLAAWMLKRKYKDKVTICLITGDMTGKYGLVSQSKPNLKRRLATILEAAIDKLAQKFDCFVFATKYMAEALGVSHKPFVVLECTYTDPNYSRPCETQPVEENEKIIFYAGALRSEYGIDHLLRAFSMIEDPDYRLWLAGGGNSEETIRKYAAEDPRIVYLGFITPEEVESRQRRATALISPRTSEHTYVKYSFASKNMEGLASGKPYIGHKLPCDPPEYDGHILYARDESDEALRDKIVEICELSQEERDAIGAKARKFILEEKNPKAMCKRIVEMWSPNP